MNAAPTLRTCLHCGRPIRDGHPQDCAEREAVRKAVHFELMQWHLDPHAYEHGCPTGYNGAQIEPARKFADLLTPVVMKALATVKATEAGE